MAVVGVNTSLSIVDYSVYSAGSFAESTAGEMMVLRWVIRGFRSAEGAETHIPTAFSFYVAPKAPSRDIEGVDVLWR